MSCRKVLGNKTITSYGKSVEFSDDFCSFAHSKDFWIYHNFNKLFLEKDTDVNVARYFHNSNNFVLISRNTMFGYMQCYFS
jgi:hypothetical protein